MNDKIIEFLNRKNIKNNTALNSLNLKQEKLVALIKEYKNIMTIIEEGAFVWNLLTNFQLKDINTRFGIMLYYSGVTDIEFERNFNNVEEVYKSFMDSMSFSKKQLNDFINNTLEITVPILMKLEKKDISSSFVVEEQTKSSVDKHIKVETTTRIKRYYEELDKIINEFVNNYLEELNKEQVRLSTEDALYRLSIIADANLTLEQMKEKTIEWNDEMVLHCIEQGGCFYDVDIELNHKTRDEVATITKTKVPNMALTFVVKETILNKMNEEK